MTGSVHRQRRRSTQFIGVLSYLVLAGLLVGMPAWLATTAGVPSIHLDVGALVHASTHRRPGDVHEVARWLGQVAVLLAWVAWAWLTVCVLVEVWAWRAGRAPVRLPASRSVQCAAAFLVGTAFAVGSFGRVPAHSLDRDVARVNPPIEAEWHGPAVVEHRVPPGGTSRPERSRMPADDRLPESDGPDPADGPSVRDRVATPAVDARDLTHVVAERETLWSVAEVHLGAARRWREIADLNYGILQSDGGSLDHSHWIQPGWVLRLPGPGDPGSVESADVHQAAPVRGRRAAPSIVLAPVATKALAPSSGAVDTGVTAVPTRDRVAGTPVESDSPGPGQRGLPVVPLGAGIVGVGVADLVDRLRRVQQRHRAVGGRIRMPDQILRPFEQRLRVGDGALDLDAVEAAVQLLVDADANGAGVGRLAGVRLDDDGVCLTFDELADNAAPPPFTREPDGRSLSVDRETVRATAGRRTTERSRFAAPTLVSVGRRDGVLAMVAVEGLGSVVIDGEPLAAESLGRAMALELATSRWAAAFDLVLVGFGAAMAHGDRVSVVSEAGPLIADLTWRRLTTSMRLAEREAPASDVARRLDLVGEWSPIVVVCSPSVPDDDVVAILDLAGDGRTGIGAVAMAGGAAVAAASGCVLSTRSSSDGASADVFGTVVLAQGVDDDDLDGIGAVIEAATVLDARPDPDADDGLAEPARSRHGARQDLASDRVSGFAAGAAGSVALIGADPRPDAETRPPVVGARTRPRPGAGPEAGDWPGIEVEVAVLGPVEVRGAARGFTRAWALELVVFLAMHPAGAANEVWATALWPDRLMAPSSLHSTASVARRSLGTTRDGSDHLPKSHGRLMLAPTVGSDWARFQDLAAADDPERWQQALETVRGRPFEGIRATDWALLDGTSPAIEAAVVDLSGRLAGARLRSGDPGGAEWAARRGLLVSPYDERLYRMLLRTADAAGNPGGVESVMAELVRVVADEIEPIESVHPSTLALYRSLSRRPSTVLDRTVPA